MGTGCLFQFTYCDNVLLSIPVSVCNDIMIYSFTQCSKWQITMNTFELVHFGKTLKK